MNRYGSLPGVATHYGDPGLGVLGSVIRATTATGTHGPGYLYNDWQTGDDAKEFRGLVITPPASGTLVAYEDGTFEFTAPADGSYSFTYRLYVDGVDLGTAVASITVGVGAGAVTAAVAATGTVIYTGTAAVVASIIDSAGAVTAEVAATGAITYTGTAAVVASVIETPISAEPVTLAEAKAAARISDTEAFDEMIPALITSARQLAEQETGRELVRKTRRSTFVDWPSAAVVIPVNDAQSVAVSYWGPSGWTPLAGDDFAFFELGAGTGIAPVVGTTWPALSAVAGGPRVRVDVTAGPLDPTTADACVKLYIKALVAWWIDNPSAVVGGSLQPAPFLRNLLDPARLWA